MRCIHTVSVFDLAAVKAFNVITGCRTAALGGHLDQCDRCQHRAISYNSCRNHHCPKCQTNARDKWLRSRLQELLPVTYYHVVFSVPHRLVPLLCQNKRVLFALLFEATAATLPEVTANPKRLGALRGSVERVLRKLARLQNNRAIFRMNEGLEFGYLAGELSAICRMRGRSLPLPLLSSFARGTFRDGESPKRR